jgi:site-specific recombinase XerD
MSNNIMFSKAVEGLILTKESEQRSEHTLLDYKNTYRVFAEFLKNDRFIDTIDLDLVEEFFRTRTVGLKTISNYRSALSVLWEWAMTKERKYVSENVIRQFKPKKPNKPDIVPISEYEIRLILSAIKTSKKYKTHGKVVCNSLPEGDRDKAIVLTLLDTGARASELCDMRIMDAEIRIPNKNIFVAHGKGDKERHVPICTTTAQAIWTYLATRPEANMNSPLFATNKGRKINRNNLGDILERAAERVSVRDIHPHRFRHTFAINFLRNGGNVYALQDILGHEDLETCIRYLHIAQTDIDTAHKIASPVANFGL